MTAPTPSELTSAKLVICSKINSARTMEVAPPAIAARVKQIATETIQVIIVA
jgi:hypothetical protein